MNREDYIELADRYEVSGFVAADPIKFPRRYRSLTDIEISAVIASWLAYGQRKVFIPKIEYILTDIMVNSPTLYILTGVWQKYIGEHKNLYRMTSWHNFGMLCKKMYDVYDKHKNLQEAVIATYHKKKYGHHYQGLCHLLTGETMIPSPMSNSANKRMNMMMRWMVRQNSLVDIGLWTKISPARLLVPCDTHSLNAAKELGILDKITENKHTCINLTNFAKTIFLEDPARLDFTLHGYHEARSTEK